MKRYFLALLSLALAANYASAQWTQIKNLPGNGTDGASSFVIDGKGYVAGGVGRNGLYMYDPATDSWTKKKNIPGPSARAWSGSFILNNMAYIVGGDTSFGALLDDVWAYDPSTDTWAQKASFPGGVRDGMQSFVIDGKAYVFGGFDGSFILGDAYMYDPATDTWSDMPSPPKVMLFASTFVLGNKGYATLWEGGSFYSDLLCFDPAIGEWEYKTACPAIPRGEGVGFAMNGKGYAGLGQTGFNKTYRDMWEYDHMSDTWKQVNDSFPIPNTGWSTAFVISNTAYVGTGTTLPDFSYSNKFYKHGAFATTTGIKEAATGNAMILYPNPASENVQVNIQGRTFSNAIVSDMLGKIVLSAKLQPGSSNINISSLSKGIYMLTVTSGDASLTQKLVVDR